MHKPLVEVLLGTFEGEQHLQEQVASIRSQNDVRVRLVARDDGSIDGTVELLRRLDIHVVEACHVGLPMAYFRLLQESGDDADFYALADQDDVWRPDKLARAVQALRQQEGPAMYCARVHVADEALAPLYPHPLPLRGPSFANALVQNIATGCTIVLNSGARAVLRDRWPDSAVMHDAWLYLVIAGTGTVLYDPAVVVDYRQHDANAVGMGRGRLSRVAKRVRRQLATGGAGAHGRQNEALQRTHLDLLTPDAARILDEFVAARSSVRRRLRYALSGAAHRQTQGSDLVLRALLALGRV